MTGKGNQRKHVNIRDGLAWLCDRYVNIRDGLAWLCDRDVNITDGIACAQKSKLMYIGGPTLLPELKVSGK